MSSKTRVKTIQKKKSDAGRDVYVKTRSTVLLSKEISKLNFANRKLRVRLEQKEAVIKKQIEILDQYREEIKELRYKDNDTV